MLEVEAKGWLKTTDINAAEMGVRACARCAPYSH
jgi:hypothetical protein